MAPSTPLISAPADTAGANSAMTNFARAVANHLQASAYQMSTLTNDRTTWY